MLFSIVNIVRALDYLVQLINLLILVRVLFSWINIDPRSGIGAFIYNVTEPIMGPIRNLIYNRLGYSGMIDFTPFVTVLLVNAVYSRLLRGFIIRILLMFL